MESLSSDGGSIDCAVDTALGSRCGGSLCDNAAIGFNEGPGIMCVVLGMMLGLVPVIARDEQTIFLVTMLPGLVIISGGIFYPIEVLPQIMQGQSAMNPVTYGSVAISEFLDADAGSELVLAGTCCDAIPGLSYAW